MKVLILAGGLGTRMLPFSGVVPKPLIAFKKKPILEHILDSLTLQGFTDITISLGYGAELIKAYCGVKNWDVRFIEETKPLGTAGPLTNFEFDDKPVLVMNGDIITDMNFRELVDFHCLGYELTVVCKNFVNKLNLGVIEVGNIDGRGLARMVERPTSTYIINCGIYVVNPIVMDVIASVPIDFPDVINKVAKVRNVGLFNLDERGYKWQAIESMAQIED